MGEVNSFFEFGLDSETATIEAWRSDLARVIRGYFARSQLSQTAFAKKLNIKQSVVSRIINGRLSGLSIEFLLRLCVKLETRGHAAWGPTPDEAYATTDAAMPEGTATVLVQRTFIDDWESTIPMTSTKSKAATSRPH